MDSSDRLAGDVLLVGSMPFDDVETVLREEARGVGGHVASLPDGEIGPRANWVGMLSQLVYSNHADLEEAHSPTDRELTQPQGDDQSSEYREGNERWTFRVKPGVTPCFDDLKYGRFATESYSIFRRLRDEGVIDSHVRFQVCLPAPASAINPFFEDARAWPQLHRAYLDGLARELDTILKSVPAGDLALQFDNAWEVVDLATGDEQFFEFWPQRSPEEKFEQHTAYLDDLARLAPEETLLGYHWCYGTWGGWPMTAMRDLSLCVRLSNEAVKRVSRQIDYFHMPVVKAPDERFVAPLDDLDVGGAKVFLGIIHDDGVEPFRRRLELVRRHLDDFGIGGVCGYGRVNPEALPAILDIHAACAAELA
jgi:hypothetical protein